MVGKSKKTRIAHVGAEMGDVTRRDELFNHYRQSQATLQIDPPEGLA